MKILTIIALIGSIMNPIKSDRYKNSVNDTGSSSFNNFVQVTYEYYCEEPSYTVGLSAGVISGETQVPLIYSIKLNIKLRDPVESAYIKLKFTSPLGTSPYWEIPALCENATIGYVDADDLYVYLYNTDYASIYIVYTYEQVMKRYGYQYIGQINALDPMSPEWIEQGYTYCDLTSVTLNSATLSTSSDYSSQLNSIMTYTDGIENYLSQIVTAMNTNNNYLSTISTNITTLSNTLNTINNNLTQLQRQNVNFELFNQSLMYKINDISSLFNSDYTSITPSSIYPQRPGAIDCVIYDVNNNINTQYDRKSLKIVFKLNNSSKSINDYYYMNVPYSEIHNPNNSSVTKNMYLYQAGTCTCIQIVFTYNDDYVKINGAYSNFQIGASFPTSPSNALSGTLSNVYLTDISISNEELLNDVVNLLNEMVVNVNIDTSDKLSVDNWYEQLKQSLDFPNVDQQELTQGFQKMGKIIKYYGMLINNSEWVLLPKLILISAMFKLFGVIIS